MYSDSINKYPQISEFLDKTKTIRREEIIENLRINDTFYIEILTKRKEQSILLSKKLTKEAKTEHESYMDLVYEQMVYELDALYETAFHDATELIDKLGILYNL